MYGASRASLCCAPRKHSTMTLGSDRPERGSDDRHNAPASGASGALPPSLENVLPGKTLQIKIRREKKRDERTPLVSLFFSPIIMKRDLLPVRTHNRIRSPR